MKNFLNKIKNNKADVEPVFFLYGIMIIMFLLWFSLDLINMNWARYTIKREAQSISRLYGLTWVDSIWDPECDGPTCDEYGTTTKSALSDSFVKIVENSMRNGGFSKFTVMITNDITADLNDCTTSIMCVKAEEGNDAKIYGWPVQTVKENIGYGTDLYLIAEGTVPYRFVGEKLGLEDNVYLVTNKFASERFGKNDDLDAGGIL